MPVSDDHHESTTATPSRASHDAASCGPGRWFPFLATVIPLTPRSFLHDLVAGLVLAAFLVPAGMGYAAASGLPAACGLYASLAALLGYFFFGPSRRLILGPDSSLTALVAIAIAIPPHEPHLVLARAALLAILSGGLCLVAGLSRLGFLTNLISMPIRLGYLNGLAITLIISQLPQLLGLPTTAVLAEGSPFITDITTIWGTLQRGEADLLAASLGGGCLAAILASHRWLPRLPAVLLVMLAAAGSVLMMKQAGMASPPVIGPVPAGLPSLTIPWLSWQEFMQLLPAAAAIALVSAADTAVLTRALADTDDGRNRPDQELAAVGLANMLAGLLQGFPVSSSSTRTPVAMLAGGRTQLTGLVAAACVVVIVLFPPPLPASVPVTALAAIVVAAATTLIDLHGLARLAAWRPGEFIISLVCMTGVVLGGVIPGIGLAVLLSLLEFVWRAWQPYSAVLGRLAGRKGYHDLSRHPEAHQIPGLVLFRWDSPLFFANAEIFRDRLLAATAAAPTQVRRVVVTAEPMTDIDVTAVDMLCELQQQLAARDVTLCFAEMKGPVKDRLHRYGVWSQLADRRVFPTIGQAVRKHLAEEGIQWSDPWTTDVVTDE